MTNREQMFIVSNNPSVWRHFSGCIRVKGSALDVMERVRNLIHKGHRLLGHPLAGSIRLLRNPYRSVFIFSQRKEPDPQAVLQVEDAYFRLSNVGFDTISEQSLCDYQYIDLSLLRALLIEGKLVKKIPL